MGSKGFSFYKKLSSDELALLSQNGDDYAFNVLATRFINTRYTDVTTPVLDADDFIQEGMVGFMNAVRTYDPTKKVPFDAYASICMRNRISTAAVNAPDDIPVDPASDDILNIGSKEDTLEDIITSERLNEVFEACEVNLSKVEKTVLFLKASGMSYAEIAKQLNSTMKSVDNAVQRARKKLKSVIADDG